MRLNVEGHLRPAIPDELDPALEKSLVEICPGRNQQGCATLTSNPLWGPHHGVFIGHAADPDIRFVASSAGIVTTAAAYLLESGKADAVLHLGADEADPSRNTAHISRSRAELVRRVGARYAPGATLRLLHSLLLSGERIVVIGKPCDIAGVRNLVRSTPEWAAQIVAALSFFCAGLPDQTISDRIITKHGLTVDDVRLLRYRGHGCPGPLRIETHDGRAFEQTYQETWEGELNKTVQFRCKICPDSTGEQADIVACDAWDAADDGYPLADSEGFNGIIARTRFGRELLDAMTADGRISAQPMLVRKLTTYQPQHARRKSVVLARLAGLAWARQPRPLYRRLGLVRAGLLGIGKAWSNMKGMIARIRRGGNREHIPGPCEISGPAPRNNALGNGATEGNAQ